MENECNFGSRRTEGKNSKRRDRQIDNECTLMTTQTPISNSAL